jgi:hypothetical protein
MNLNDIRREVFLRFKEDLRDEGFMEDTTILVTEGKCYIYVDNKHSSQDTIEFNQRYAQRLEAEVYKNERISCLNEGCDCVNKDNRGLCNAVRPVLMFDEGSGLPFECLDVVLPEPPYDADCDSCIHSDSNDGWQTSFCMLAGKWKKCSYEALPEQ